jgi:pyruvate dehydrogenase E1 component alpha subunit/2-oxoisovalerate dehydrogenase E1 component alpha subunit
MCPCLSVFVPQHHPLSGRCKGQARGDTFAADMLAPASFPAADSSDPARATPMRCILTPDGTLAPGAAIPAGLDDEKMREGLRWMLKLRRVDERMLTLQRQGRISFYGSATGQEASVIGSGLALAAQDWILPGLREGGILLMRGYPLQVYVDQLYGNGRDLQKGRQMPCHYGSHRFHFATLSSPIATQLPHAVGVAYAARLRGDDVVAAGFLGDGATSEGDFHVAGNMAQVLRVPAVFVIQNNQWAISVPAARQSAAATLAQKAAGWGMPQARADGNDLCAVWEAVADAVRRARAGEGPTLVELVTYRVGAHSTSDDPSVYRDESVTAEWKTKRDPITRLRAFLAARGRWTDDEERAHGERIEAEITECVRSAEAAAPPALETLFEDTWAGGVDALPWHLREQFADARHWAAARHGGAAASATGAAAGAEGRTTKT